MAGYPPDPPYGSNYGEQNMPSYDQQHMAPANRRVASNPNYPPPNPSDAFAAYNMANAQYNANLPAFGANSFTPAPYASAPNVPSFQMPQAAWNSSAVMPSNSMGWQQPPFNFAQPSTPQYGLPRLDTNMQQQVPQNSVDVGVQPVEEGELSEGEFQDNFDGKIPNPIAGGNNNMSGSYYRPDLNGDRFNNSPRGNAYRDSPRSAVGPNLRRPDQSFSQHRQDLSYTRNHQSDDYSPYGSPRQHTDTRGKQPNKERGYAQKSTSAEVVRDFQRPSEALHTATQRTPDPLSRQPLSAEDGERMAIDESNNNDAETLHDIPDDDRYSPELERPPTPDKRTLAQHAILNLMAAKVQFQDYIQEGVDETLMHGLFESLGMPQTRPKAIVDSAVSTSGVLNNDLPNGHGSQSVKAITAQSNQPESSRSSDSLLKLKSASESLLKANSSSDKFLNRRNNTNGETAANNNQQITGGQRAIESAKSPSNSNVTPTDVLGTLPNGEERKDKIARLLAEKKKGTVPSPTTESVPNGSKQAATTADEAAKIKAEKGRLLNIKIENLRKSREARSLKNEAANKAPVTPVATEAKSAEVTLVSPLQSSSYVPTPALRPQAKEASQVPSVSASHTAANTVSQPVAELDSSANQKVDTGATVPLLTASASKETAVTQVAPTIPGLFLSSTGAAVSPSTNSPRSVPTVSHRKRPVAADFDEPTPSSAYKRPFGQSRVETPLVIDVSDDEASDGDEGSAMDLDRPESSHDSSGPISDVAPSKANLITRNQQSEPENRHAAAPPVPLAQTAQSNAKPSPDDLKSKMEQIAELHKKIAEAEAKKKAKASANRSGSQTPLTTEGANAQQTMVNEAIAEKNKASAELERLLEGADAQIASETQKLADTAAKEQEKAAEMKQQDTERKRKRRSEIQLGLPAVDAEVEKNQQRLEELRAEMAKAEAAIQKSLEDKQKLESEMAKLGDEAEEVSQTEQSQELNLPVREAQSSNAIPERVDDPALEDSVPGGSSSDMPTNVSHSLQNGVSHENLASPTEVINSILPEDVDMSNGIPHQEEPKDTPEDSPLSNVLGETISVIPNEQSDKFSTPDSRLRSTSKENDKEDVAQNSSTQQIADEIVQARSPMSVSADQVLEAALQQASAQAEEESRVNHNSDTEMGNTFAPDPSQLEPALPASHYTNEGEVHDDSGAQTSAHDSPIQVEEAADEESDAYEPPEATPPPAVLGDDAAVINSPPFSPAPPEVTSAPSPKAAPEVSAPNLETTDTIEPLGSRNTVEDQEIPVPAIVTQGHDHSSSKRGTFFTPYESPLKRFPSYRFNKNFSDEVSGGFRSITYSHRIDPMKIFCRFELAGGACNDPNCEFQHFKDLNLADDMILLQLGDSETFNSQPEIKDSFVTGLRGVLQDLKARKIRDFPTIASEIAAFRAKFNKETLVL